MLPAAPPTRPDAATAVALPVRKRRRETPCDSAAVLSDLRVKRDMVLNSLHWNILFPQNEEQLTKKQETTFHNLINICQLRMYHLPSGLAKSLISFKAAQRHTAHKEIGRASCRE